ncbi:MAG TPA: RagB/SusD family nutrient uptake outer membrane protein, partial [Chitinophagaceae bacterium]|nr:RagB/SusD family nutrient uptake outer membrane protein [Chitinophagaceae bacterium]
KPFYVDLQVDYDWSVAYQNIYIFNTVINGVQDSKGGDQTLKNTVYAEALVHRAFTYFTLVNLYSKAYNASTAANDMGVPVLLEAKLFVDLTRPSVQKVYDQILSDLQTALPLLPVKQDVNFRPSKAAAYALLAKTHLFMRHFNEASAFADSSLALSSDLNDYKNFVATTPFNFPSQYLDKEVLFRKIPRLTLNTIQLSPSLLNLLGTADLRYKLFVKSGNNFSPAFTGSGYWPRDKYSGGYPDKVAVGLTVSETWLIKAECLARTGKGSDALTILNNFRKMRFATADYTSLTAASDAEALALVINERRLEFFGSGLRWLDQRRLSLDPQFAQSYTRVFDNVTYKLDPNSNQYVFPLANLLIAQSPEMQQNP